MSIAEDQAGSRSTDDVASPGSGWMAVLAEQAALEFALAVYGLHDCRSGQVGTMAAMAVARVQAQGAVLTHERAEQRARAYLPLEGYEHCPRCWVLGGAKSLLHFAQSRELVPGLARCSHCGAEYVNPGGSA